MALLHDEFIELIVVRNWVVSVKTREAEFVLGSTRSANHSLGAEISDGIGAEVFANLGGGALVGEEFLGVGKIDSVVTGVLVRRATDAHVDLGRAVLAKVDDS